MCYWCVCTLRRIGVRILISSRLETVAFHLGVTLTSAAIIRLVDIWSSFFQAEADGSRPKSGVRQEFRHVKHVALVDDDCHLHLFRLSHVPLTLLYSSLTKLFLLLLLTLWKPSRSSRSNDQTRLSEQYTGSLRHALELLDDDKLNREWVVRNVLGGMAAGFGLRGECSHNP